jgi:hypothetical protein
MSTKTRQPLTVSCHFSEPKNPEDRDGITRISVDCGFRTYSLWFYDAWELEMLLKSCIRNKNMPPHCAEQAIAAARDYLGSYLRNDPRDYAVLVEDEFDCDVIGGACTTARWPGPNWPIIASVVFVILTGWMCWRIL